LVENVTFKLKADGNLAFWTNKPWN